MKVISIINLKGGVAKTISAVNMAHILATVHGKRVLLIDNDKQGNVSKMFGVHS
ncbi:MAG: ParA family protein, partial [Clostridia bacterium]|nr:ParA family protein [Clostridia bacterium]